MSKCSAVSEKSRKEIVSRRKEHSAVQNAVKRENKMMTEKYPPDLAT